MSTPCLPFIFNLELHMCLVMMMLIRGYSLFPVYCILNVCNIADMIWWQFNIHYRDHFGSSYGPLALKMQKMAQKDREAWVNGPFLCKKKCIIHITGLLEYLKLPISFYKKRVIEPIKENSKVSYVTFIVYHSSLKHKFVKETILISIHRINMFEMTSISLICDNLQ